jgi:predicted N-acetyltransferase YhbS
MISIRQERSTDIGPRERLLDAAFGPARVLKTCERLRERRFAAEGLSFVAITNGRLVGSARLA